MKSERWLRIIPVALLMYTIAYVDRTNVAQVLTPKLSSMMQDLMMDDKMKGEAAGIFFFGYMLLQIPGGYLANRWSAKKFVSILLVFWGICAVICGLVHTFVQFKIARFMLGVAESGVYPATLVLLARWFPRAERARANAYFNLCMPLSAAVAAPVTSWLLKGDAPNALAKSWGMANWQFTLVVEGMLPFVWLPVWLYFVSDRPRDARWISPEERQYLDTTLEKEAQQAETGPAPSWLQVLCQPAILVMIIIYFLQNCAAYGCNTFLSSSFVRDDISFTPLQQGLLFSIPYLVTAVVMVINSKHSDKTQERRGHTAAVYAMSGICLIASVLASPYSFWLTFFFLCFAIPGPFAALAPFWTNASETIPRAQLGVAIGIINAVGNLGGYYGNSISGWLTKQSGGSTNNSFIFLGSALLVAAVLCCFLPKARTTAAIAPEPAKA